MSRDAVAACEMRWRTVCAVQRAASNEQRAREVGPHCDDNDNDNKDDNSQARLVCLPVAAIRLLVKPIDTCMRGAPALKHVKDERKQASKSALQVS